MPGGSKMLKITTITEKENVVRVEGLKRILGRLSPWKATGTDGVQDYWVSNFKSLHTRIVNQMNDIFKKKKLAITNAKKKNGANSQSEAIYHQIIGC